MDRKAGSINEVVEYVYHKYTDTAGRTHYLTTGDGTTAGGKEYVIDQDHPWDSTYPEGKKTGSFSEIDRKKIVKKLITHLLIVIAITGMAATASASYTYDFESAIPHQVQEEAFQSLYDTVSGLREGDKSFSYSELLDIYIRFYGIYSPESMTNNNTVIWVQEHLIADEDRTTFIPDRYTTQEDLTGWVERYAEPGDLLLYRLNGKPDRCVVYAGNGTAIGRDFKGNKIIDVRATYSDKESHRTKSGGLFAISHMWKEEKSAETACVDLRLKQQRATDSFSQTHFTVWEENAMTGKLEKSTRYILMEYAPGEYRFWNGEFFGFSEKYVRENNGIHVQLTNTKTETSQINPTIKISLSMEEALSMIDSDRPEIDYEIRDAAANTFQWAGTDLLKILRPEVQAHD